jgi:hypothetical protein
LAESRALAAELLAECRTRRFAQDDNRPDRAPSERSAEKTVCPPIRAKRRDTYVLTNVYGDLDFWFMARSRMLFGVGVPLIFIPIIAASYDGLPPGKTDQASAMLNAARNTGGSIGISLVQNVLWDREQFHQSMLVDQAIPSGVPYQDTLHQMTNYFIAQGSSLVQASAGHPMDRTAGAGASLVPGLYGRVLVADADLARRRAARVDLAQGQARRRRSRGPLVRTTRW